ncbi:MAG TPA: hypothetical protein VGC99_17835 [Candidatus Tectomicrobia bacterium]
MKPYVLVLMVLMLLTVPLVVGADDQGWMPPEWTPTPPARPSVDFLQLVQLLVAKGVISDQEYAQLTQPQLSSRSQPGQARVWTWNEVYRNPVRSRP